FQAVIIGSINARCSSDKSLGHARSPCAAEHHPNHDWHASTADVHTHERSQAEKRDLTSTGAAQHGWL
ncbi:hypothetical protein, partial [Streptomyces sp. NRRL S-495]|uniref:hypothetical protein n=1 Tax=Streptomyces sp. NRRL S-495 TaxID=1609133 RepID=UPI002570719F